MSRKHLFTIVVLLGAAAVAALLAVTRTTTAGTPASSAQILAKSRRLDQLEASLQRALAEHPRTLPVTQRAAGAPARTVYLRSGATVQAPAGEGEHEHGEDGYEHVEPSGFESSDD